MISSDTARLLDHLHRAGQWGYWWTMEGRQSFWWEIGKRTPLPGGQRSVYFGVHPTSEIPKTNIRGEQKPAHELRAQLPIIAAINCLYTELDMKDFGGDKEKTRAAVDALVPPPSVLIDSGGGYHLYYLLDEPWLLRSDEDRQAAKQLQAAWVTYTGGDGAVKDLARVLRVPGTYNHKYQPPRKVTVVFAHFDRQYARNELATLCAHLTPDDRLPDVTHTGSTTREPANREVRYARAALDREVAAVLRAPKGLKHNTIRDAALKLGTMVARGWLSDEEVVHDIVTAADLHRADVADTRRAVLDGLAYGKQRPHKDLPPAPERAETTATHEPGTDADTLPILLRATELHRIPPAIALIRDVLFVNTLHQFFGTPGSAKSFLLLDIACTVAQHYRVVYVAAEAIEDYEARVNAWAAHYGRSVENLYFWREPLRLADERGVQHFIATIHALAPALVVFDPLADCMVGLDENSAVDMGIAIAAFNTVRRDTHAAVAVVHHTGWNDERERGHSLLRGACRIVVKVEMRDDGQIRFACVKKNQGLKFTARLFRLVSAGTMGSVLPLPAHLVLSGRTKPTERMLKVMDALTTQPLRGGATHTQLMQDTQITAGTLNRVLTVLADSGFVSTWEKGRATYYQLTDTGTDALEIAASEGSTAGQQQVEDKMEDSGRSRIAYNWFVLSSTDTGLQEAVLPNTITLSSTEGTAVSPYSTPFRGVEYGELSGAAELSSKSSSTPSDAEQWGALAQESDDELFPDEEIAVSAPAINGYRKLDWTLLEASYRAGNMTAITAHCSIRQQNIAAVMDELAARTGIERNEDAQRTL